MTSRTLMVTATSLLCLVSQVHAQGDATRGKQVFSICAPCHTVSQKTNRMGPHLVNIINRPAGSVEDYKGYSQAIKDVGANGLVWSEDQLSQFLISPKKFLPGTSMRFFGFWEQEKVDDLIAYLKEQAVAE